MNLKFNLWTVLFLIALGYILGKMFMQKNDNTHEDSSSEVQSADPRFNVPDSLFTARYNVYKSRYLPVVNNPVLNLKDSVQVDTLGMLYWSMDQDEVQEMFDKISTINTIQNHPEVRIYPTIHDFQGGSEMDLIFEILDTRNNTQDYYDFTKPCPPTCGTE